MPNLKAVVFAGGAGNDFGSSPFPLEAIRDLEALKRECPDGIDSAGSRGVAGTVAARLQKLCGARQEFDAQAVGAIRYFDALQRREGGSKSDSLGLSGQMQHRGHKNRGILRNAIGRMDRIPQAHILGIHHRKLRQCCRSVLESLVHQVIISTSRKRPRLDDMRQEMNLNIVIPVPRRYRRARAATFRNQHRHKRKRNREIVLNILPGRIHRRSGLVPLLAPLPHEADQRRLEGRRISRTMIGLALPPEDTSRRERANFLMQFAPEPTDGTRRRAALPGISFSDIEGEVLVQNLWRHPMADVGPGHSEIDDPDGDKLIVVSKKFLTDGERNLTDVAAKAVSTIPIPALVSPNISLGHSLGSLAARTPFRDVGLTRDKPDFSDSDLFDFDLGSTRDSEDVVLIRIRRVLHGRQCRSPITIGVGNDRFRTAQDGSIGILECDGDGPATMWASIAPYADRHSTLEDHAVGEDFRTNSEALGRHLVRLRLNLIGIGARKCHRKSASQGQSSEKSF